MGKVLNLAGAVVVASGTLASGGAPRAGEAEEIVAQHMVGEALLAAHLVALAEKTGMSPQAINALLKDVADNSGIDEFWITDETGRAYLTNEDFEFTFSQNPATEPQASAFWPLLTGEKKVVIQEARQREVTTGCSNTSAWRASTSRASCRSGRAPTTSLALSSNRKRSGSCTARVIQAIRRANS